MEKGEIARNEQFLLFPQCFLLKQLIVPPFVHMFAIISLFAPELEEPKIGIWGKGFSYHGWEEDEKEEDQEEQEGEEDFYCDLWVN